MTLARHTSSRGLFNPAVPYASSGSDGAALTLSGAQSSSQNFGFMSMADFPSSGGGDTGRRLFRRTSAQRGTLFRSPDEQATHSVAAPTLWTTPKPTLSLSTFGDNKFDTRSDSEDDGFDSDETTVPGFRSRSTTPTPPQPPRCQITKQVRFLLSSDGEESSFEESESQDPFDYQRVELQIFGPHALREPYQEPSVRRIAIGRTALGKYTLPASNEEKIAGVEVSKLGKWPTLFGAEGRVDFIYSSPDDSEDSDETGSTSSSDEEDTITIAVDALRLAEDAAFDLGLLQLAGALGPRKGEESSSEEEEEGEEYMGDDEDDFDMELEGICTSLSQLRELAIEEFAPVDFRTQREGFLEEIYFEFSD
ncbi:hypothetical protein BDV98DRAFT_629853 [Pterulicium gracile]|uniref:Uncharacterized protein n=1 Tax=Pterulicium gracile TaxID=1884261 RepID=A0A5C3QUG6_9AGAR|nr:hypothetical protein BDV98DRAFT_629853 [Pterula gracilis]